MTLSNRENHHVHQKLVKRFNKSLEVDTDSLAKRQAQATETHSQRVVVVTRIVGTTVVTGTPPGPSSNGNAVSTSVQAVTSQTPSPTSQAPVFATSDSPTSSSTPPASTSSIPTPSPDPIPTPSSSSVREVVSDTRSVPSLLIGSTRVTASTRFSSTSTRSSSVAVSSSSASSAIAAAVVSGPASSASVNVNAAGGTKGDDGKEDSSGMSTGGIVGIVAGVLLGIAALLLLAGALWKRKNRKQAARPYSTMAPFGGGEKERQRYRDSSWPINDKREDGDFGNVNTYDPFGYPPGSGEKPSRRPDTVFSQTGNFAGVGRSNFVIAEDYDDQDAQYVSQGQMREIGGAGTRDLTGAGAYGRYTDVTPPSHHLPMFGSESAYPIQHAYYQDGPSSHDHGGYSEDGRHTPTDYYGQAMSPSGVAVADEFADFPAYMHEASQSTAGKAPIQGGWQASAGVAGAGAAGGLMVAAGLGLAGTRSLSPVERAGKNENDVYAQQHLGRVQLQDSQGAPSMPQLPPLSLDSISSPLYSGFSDPGNASRRNSATQEVEMSGANLHRKSSSAQPTALMYGSKKTEEELKRGYADLARAAEIDALITKKDDDLMMPPMMPERYVHGRPLSPLFEAESPELGAATTLHDERNPFTSGGLRISNGDARPAITVRQSSDTRPASELRASIGIPSAKFPPPSPDISLPESPASYVANGPVTPRVHNHGADDSVNSTPEYSFKVHPPGASAVSLEAFPTTPQRHPLAVSAGPSPVSIQSSSGLPRPPPIGASRLSTASSFSDAYDGI